MFNFYSKRKAGDKRKIVIVEDEVLSSADMSAFLSAKGYEIPACAINAEDALFEIEKHRPDLVLMDIRIKGEVDGISAAITVKENFNIPVIFITAYADRETLERAKVAEPYGYILKPFAEHDLFASVEMAINKKEAEMAAGAREVLFSAVLKHIGDGVIVTDDDYNIFFSNIAACSITGIEESGLENKNLYDIFLTEGMDKTKFPHEGTLCQSRYEKPDGRTADIEYQYDRVSSQPLSFSGGIFVFRDVTERAKNEAKIQNTLMMLRKAMGGIIQAMAVTVETRDPYTAGHQKRVTELARKIADYMNLKDDIKDGLRMAGIIHDIGKISVPAEILSKPGKLSDIEFSLIKNHPQSGYEILKNIEFPWPVAMIVRQHHERLDGSGYPDGIKSDEILIESKILAVADVVEAMASHRPYRASLGIHAAIDEIIKNKGKYYDPDVVNACVAVFAKGDFSFD